MLVAFSANLGVATAKFVGFAFTGAASLLAEAVHSVADSGNQLLLLFGAASARRSPTPEHPFGYGRERYFWAFVVAVVLFTLGGVFAIMEGVEKFRHPEAIRSPAWALGILGTALVLEGYALRTAVLEALKHKGTESWWTFLRQAKSAALPVILLEDLGALIGLTLALACVSLSLWTGDPRFDALGSAAIGALLCAIAWFLGSEMRSLLIGESASPAVQRQLRSALESHDGVARLIHMRTQHLGPDELLVGAKVELAPTLSLVEAARVINSLEVSIRSQVPSARLIYIEPDVFVSELRAPD